MLPPKDIIEKYVQYASTSTDAPILFHKACAWSAIATCIGRNLFIKYGHQRLYPNLYTIILGKSTRLRKSTSLGIALDLINMVDEDLRLPSNFSEEAFIKAIETRNEGIICVMEFLSLMSLMEKEYASGMKSFLTEVYDCPVTHKISRMTGDKNLHYPVINLLSATTLDWFLERINEGDLRSGFLARFIFIDVKEDTKFIPFPIPRDEKLRDSLRNDLGWIRQQTNQKTGGEILLDKDARATYDVWATSYNEMTKKYDKTNIGPNLMRLLTSCLKFSIITALGRGSPEIILKEHVQEACQIVEELTKNLVIFLNDELTFDEYNKLKKRVHGIIIEAGTDGIAQGAILKKVGVQHKRLIEVLEGLKSEESIDLLSKTPHKGRPTNYYIAKKNS